MIFPDIPGYPRYSHDILTSPISFSPGSPAPVHVHFSPFVTVVPAVLDDILGYIPSNMMRIRGSLWFRQVPDRNIPKQQEPMTPGHAFGELAIPYMPPQLPPLGTCMTFGNFS